MSKKTKNIIFNIFWIIFTGIPSAIYNGIMGALCCVTIIGIPFGLQYFKFIPLVFAPAGKTVVTHFDSNPVMNILWLVFGGLGAGVYHYFLSILYSITGIGHPIGKQLRKIAAFNFFPFGIEIIKDDRYSMNRNTEYDYNLLAGRIFADVANKKMPSGTTVLDYLQKECYKDSRGSKLINPKLIVQFKVILTFVCVTLICVPVAVVFIILVGVIMEYMTGPLYLISEISLIAITSIIVGIIFGLLAFLISMLVDKILNVIGLKHMKPQLDELFELYPDGSDINERARSVGLLYCAFNPSSNIMQSRR